MWNYNVRIDEVIIDGDSVRGLNLVVLSESNARPTNEEVKEQVQRMYGGNNIQLAGNRWTYVKN